jgi:hypothetical protein
MRSGRLRPTSRKEPLGDAGMSAGQRIELVLTYRVVSFDGRVLELFGGTAERIHVATITGIDYDGGEVTIHTSDQTQRSIRLQDSDEDKRGDLESLVDKVRRAAPNLGEA